MKAYCLIREAPWYRREVFCDGLRKAGHEVLLRPPSMMCKDTLLVTWNRYGTNHEIASQVERNGGVVVVAENGYIGKGGTSPKFDVHPHGPKPDHYYALSIGYHNGGGKQVPSNGDMSRFDALGVEIKSWRRGGDYVLICPNRSFGPGHRRMPPDWARHLAAALGRSTKRPIRIREHPGNNSPKRALAEDLKDAWCVFIWSSSCGIHALLEGIPVCCSAPNWIMDKCSSVIDLKHELASTSQYPRERGFAELAYAQWTCAEIATGEPFDKLLSCAR